MTVLAISDLHAPGQNPRALEFLANLKRQYKPDTVVVLGDLLDHHCLSTFSKNPNLPSTSIELAKAKEFLQKLYKLFPVALVTYGNHDVRAIKRAKEVGISTEYLKSLPEVIGAPKGWIFNFEHRLDGVLYTHGDGFTGLNATQNIVKSKLTNCVFGHTHLGCIQYYNGLWGCNAGCLIDPNSPYFEYAQFSKNKSWIGTAVIKDGVPHLVPLSPSS